MFVDRPCSSTRANAGQVLQSSDEITYNTIWRFLHLRGYVNENHFLTPWGKALQHGLTAAGSDSECQEAVFIAVELLRLDILHQHYMFNGYSHAPMRGSGMITSSLTIQIEADCNVDDDRKYNTLISRVASLGRLRHNAIGFTGPLSRHLLGYHSMTTTMRQALRDLEEMCLLTLFLGGDADREKDNLAELSLRQVSVLILTLNDLMVF